VTPPQAAILPFLLFWVLDFGRYGIAGLVLAVQEGALRWARRRRGDACSRVPPGAPLVSVVMAGFNEADSMPVTLRSLAEQTWPRMEVIVVDDGSVDGTSTAVRPFLEEGGRPAGDGAAHSSTPRPWLRLVTLRRRNGKAAALNTGLLLARGEFVVFVDADTSFDRDAIEAIVRPMLEDPRCGAVAGNLLVRNARATVLTELVATEYLFSISLGRRFRSMLNLLNVVSGAFGAFRRELLVAVGGHTPTSGNDGDLTLKIRRVTDRIVFAHQAICMTKTPATWPALVKQRRRWDRNLVKNKLRRHRDLLDLSAPAFRWSNAALLVDAVMFNLVLGSRWVIAFVFALIVAPGEVPRLAALSYAIHLASCGVKLGAAQWIQPAPPAERLKMALFLPLYPLYRAVLRLVRLYAYGEELVHQRSYWDVFAPAAVSREAQEFDNASDLAVSDLARGFVWPWRRVVPEDRRAPQQPLRSTSEGGP
jgi:glycosyltransferase involved in cell wall biosynthesis